VVFLSKKTAFQELANAEPAGSKKDMGWCLAVCAILGDEVETGQKQGTT